MPENKEILALLNNDTISITTQCYHCGDDCIDNDLRIEDKVFCCTGCKMVYELLNENGLCTYYTLNEHPGSKLLQHRRKNKFAYLDNQDLVASLISFADETRVHVTFSVPQMHCSSCLWLLEHLNTIEPGILATRVNFTKKEVFVVFNSNETNLRAVVETMAIAGYEPCIATGNKTAVKVKKNHRLVQIAIAGFCFANIMMLSLPEYFSVTGYLQGKIGLAFRGIGFLLALPVFFYCSQEFFLNAYRSAKNGFLNIDVSIALAILLTFVRSLYNLFILDGNTYFDSMSGIVFFMLVGRWAQDKTQQSLMFDRDYKSFFPVAVNVIKNNSLVPVLIGELNVHDLIEVYDQEIVPADGVLVSGKALIDYSFVTGESLPRVAKCGAIIYAGGRQLGGRIEVRVEKKSDQGYLTNLWNKDGKPDSERSKFLHRASNYFTISVFVLTLGAAIFWLANDDYTRMWNALTTTLIVACPCALLLAATFTNGHVMRVLNRAGLFLKNAAVIDELAKITHIVLDKTGTITCNKKIRVRYSGTPLTPYENILLASVARHSAHPLSQAISGHLKIRELIALEGFSNIPGGGIAGVAGGHHIKIGSAGFVRSGAIEKDAYLHSRVFIEIDGQVPGYFILENEYRPGLAGMLRQLMHRYDLSIASGDNNAELLRLTQMVGGKAAIYFNQSPGEKYSYVETLQQAGGKVLMAGDGLNDAGALRKSNVGIAVMEGHSSLTPASDGIISAAAFTALDKMLAFSRSARAIVMTSFIVSILYNIIGLCFALRGMLEPVVAAILMPASTISIILITFLMAEYHGRKLKRIRV